MKKINIANLDKASLLQALFNRSRPLGLGFYDRKSNVEMTYKEARKEISDTPRLFFDYVNGRPIKVDLSENDFYPGVYDKYNGAGSAEKVVDLVRSDQKALFNKATPQNAAEELAAQGDIIEAIKNMPLQIRSFFK